MRVLDLFSGIGGLSLGLERAGMKTVAFCEIEPFPRAVIRKHWPEVPIYEDVRTLTAERLATDGIAVDVICGGFPCQDISFAGLGAGLAGERSGLWREYARLIGEIRPRFVIVENVAALLSRGLGDVLGDLASFGYDAEWHCIPASAVGAPHRRDRLWVVAHPNESGPQGLWSKCGLAESLQEIEAGGARDVADATSWGFAGHLSQDLAKSIHADSCGGSIGSQWRIEPDVGRVAYGVPSRVDRLKGLGNAVVPQIPEMIGRAIMQQVAA